MSGRRVKPQPAPRAGASVAREHNDDRRARWGAGLLIAALAISALAAGRLNDRVEVPGVGATLPEYVAFPMAALLVAASAACMIPASAWRPRSSPQSIGICLLLLFGGLSAAISPFKHAAVVSFAILLAAVLAGASTAWISRDRARAAWLFHALWLAGLLVACLGVREYVETWRSGRSDWRVFGPFADPNFLAGYLVLTIPIAAAAFLGLAQRSLTVLAGVALVMQVLCLLLTQSRLGLAALVAGGAVLAWAGWRSEVVTGRARRRAIALLVCILVAGFVGARPVMRRLTMSGGEGYSARFRVLTWAGAQSMAAAHPVLGAGLGGFEFTYPRYARVGFTAHAHNSYVQLASEIGYPGVFGLLIVIAGVLAAGTVGLQRLRAGLRATGAASLPGVPDADPMEATEAPRRNGRRGRRPALDAEVVTASLSPAALAHVELRLVVVGLLAAVAGASVHNLFDSDLYIPSIALTFAVTCGLLNSVATASGGDAPSAPRSTVAPRLLTIVGAIALVCLVFPPLAGRMQAYEADRAGDDSGRAQAYREALSVDPWNADYMLSLAPVLLRTGAPDEARRAYERAVAVAPSATALRRLGKLLAWRGETQSAVRLLERARRGAPNDLQTLIALAEQYTAAGRHADALAVYRDVVVQYRGPVGQVRAVPELIDWEYGAAYLGVGQEAATRGDNARAEPSLREAVAILGEFWRTRNDPMARQRRGSTEALEDAARRYEVAMESWASALEALGRLGEAEQARGRLARFRTERDAERAGARSTLTP